MNQIVSLRRVRLLMAAFLLAGVVGVGAVNGIAHARTAMPRLHPKAHAASNCSDARWISAGNPLWIRSGEGTGYPVVAGPYNSFPNGANFHATCNGSGWLYASGNWPYKNGYVNAYYAVPVSQG